MEKPFPLFILTRAVISQQLWGICKLDENELSLSLHGQQSEKKIFDLNLPTYLSCCLKQDLLLLEQAYNDAFDWLRHYEKEIGLLKSHRLNVILDKQYCLSKFITPTGEFNDLDWVRQFVDDQQLCVLDRFYFACFYCFEEKVRPLWEQTLNKGWYRKKDYVYIRHFKPMLVSFWIHYLEGKQTELLRTFTPLSLFMYGFKMSVSYGNEKAVHYFWNKLSEQERTSLINDIDDYATTIYGTIHHKYPKILHFLYSQLNPLQQQRVLQYYFQRNRYPSIWYCYLQRTALIFFIPEQIAQHQASLPPEAFSSVLYHLACKMEKVGNPIYQQVFRTVWKLGSTENKNAFLQDELYTLLMLLSGNKFTCIRDILREASPEQNKYFLFQTAYDYRFWKECLYKKDISTIRNYLLLFLTDLQQEDVPSKLTPFRADSLSLLKEFQEESYFIKDFLKDIPKEKIQFLLSILGDLRLEIEISDILKVLLQKTDENLLYTTSK